MDEEIARTLLVKPEVFVYKIPPRASARGYRAADWNLATPDWTGRLRLTSKGNKCEIQLEDKGSGELFAACPVESYPGTSVEAVTDSSRYFVICVQDSGRKAYIGIGFADRSDSFDLNVALQDHFKWVKKETALATETPAVNLDLAFKEGQTIRINIPKNKDVSGAKARPGATAGGGPGGGFLPPPPGGVKKPPQPPGAASLTPMRSPSSEDPQPKSVIGCETVSNVDLLGDLLQQPPSSSDDPWGDFTSASTGQTASSSGNWVQF